MFKPENKIIIVDDMQDHLNALSKPFHENGIGCRCFKYDVNYETPLENIRIAFFDINLNPSGGGSDSKRFNDVANALKQYISIDNGPFALIFWTSKKDDVENIKKYIEERHKSDCPSPFMVDCIDKDEFLNSPNKLIEKLKEIMKDETLNILLDFENISSISAIRTINQIYNIIPKNDPWGNNGNFKDNLEQIFSKISTSTLGFEHAKKNPDKAVYEALIPILNYFISDTKSDKWNSYLVSLKSARKRDDIKITSLFKESMLNTIFHIDLNDFTSDVRGAVIELNKTETEFEPLYGVKFDSWFTSFLPINNRNDRRRIRNDSKLIAIEISSACDFSQNKKRLNKYILAVICEPIKKEDFQFIADCSFLIGTFSMDTEFQIWANLNYVFSAYPNDDRFIKPVFVLKKEIMDMIGNRYANHVSRIGITSF